MGRSSCCPDRTDCGQFRHCYAGAGFSEDTAADRHGVLLVVNRVLAPSKFEAWFVMLPHTDADIDRTLAGADEVLAAHARSI